VIFDDERLLFSPHPSAPTFSKESNPALLLQQLMDEIGSPNASTQEKLLVLYREAGFVSLWFYLKFILGFAGPYDKLNDRVHLAMCNFRQRVATEPGIKAGAFTPRSLFKSTIFTHGGGSWEALRNPNIRMAITSSIFDRAFSFVQQIIANFSDNELHRSLYPEYGKANRSNDCLVLSNRTKRFIEPTCMPMTAGGSTQGVHVDLFNPDDIVGDDMLNADHAATADMNRMTNWLHTNLRTLVVDWTSSRVLAVGTRYGLEDPYERIMSESKERIGFWDDVDYDENPKGEWTTFYVPALIEGESICSEAFTVEALKKLAETDPWTYQSQYANNPKAAKAGDLAGYTPDVCTMEYIEGTGYVIVYKDERIQLKFCDVVIAADPAGGEKRAGRKTSRSAIAVVARDPLARRFLIEAQAGFWPTTKLFDKLFEMKKKYGIIIRATYLETQGAFKALLSPLREDQLRRNVMLNLQGVPALGDKETTIRNIIQPLLDKGQLIVRGECRFAFNEELRAFPGSKMDLLDATKIALNRSHAPAESDEDDDECEARSSSRHHPQRCLTTGY
jgi:hypothetical protein